MLTCPVCRPLPLFCGLHQGQEGSAAELDATTASYHFHEPYGVVGQNHSGTSPAMAAWKLAPALAAGNCVVAEARRADPVTILPGDGADTGHSARWRG